MALRELQKEWNVQAVKVHYAALKETMMIKM